MNPEHLFDESADNTTPDSAWEHQEDMRETEKLLRLQIEVLAKSLELTAQLLRAQQAAMNKSLATHGETLPHYCQLCLVKRRFVAHVQFMAMIKDLRGNTDHGIGAVVCANRMPATRLANLNLAEAASLLIAWYYDSALPEEQRTIPQPLWYSKESLENDGHE